MANKPGLPEDKPGFFKVLLGDFSKRLQIPPAFAKFFYQTPLPQMIKLENSEKSCWQVNLVEIDSMLFFKRGWKAFVKDNHLELGDFVVFNYVEGSMFRFTIFGRNSCEKDVAAIHRQTDELVSGNGRKKRSTTMAKNRQIIEGTMFDSTGKRYGKVSDKNRADRSGSKINDKPVVIEIEDTDEEDDISVEFVEKMPELGEKRKRTEFKPSVTCTQHEGKEAGGSIVAWSERASGLAKSREGNGGKFTTRNSNQRTPKLIGKEKSLALERAEKAFKSRNPSFMVAIQPSYIGVGRNNNTNIALEFVETYFNKETNNVILELPGGSNSWPMKYYISRSKRIKRAAKLNSGWLDFAVDNHLAVGDVCVFEMINRAENVLRVYIFRNI